MGVSQEEESFELIIHVSSFIEMAALITSSSWPGELPIFQSFMNAVTYLSHRPSQVLLFVQISKNMHVFLYC
jgi:hypothetical protein